MKKLNRHYLSHSYTTDVLCFPLETAGIVEAELYVNLDRARAQADQFIVPYGEETRRLLIHGTLHLLGYRDSTRVKRKTMRMREEFYLTKRRGRGQVTHV